MDRETALKTIQENATVQLNREVVSAGTIGTYYFYAGDGHPVILLHGAGAGGIAWAPVMGKLSSRNHIIAPDIVGYGESDKPRAAYGRSFYSAWLRDFIDALAMERVSLVGHSLGGAIALHFSLEYPECVKRLVLVGSAGLGSRIPLGALIGTIWMNTCPSKMASRWACRQLFYAPEDVDEALIAYRLEVARMPGSRYVFWRGAGRTVAPFDPEQLSLVRPPTLIIWGEKERFFPVEYARTACMLIPDAHLHLIPDAGHCPYIEQPEAFSEVTNRFLTGEIKHSS